MIGVYVGLQNRVLLTEVRLEMSILEKGIVQRINGTYVRAGECSLREAAMVTRFEDLGKRMDAAATLRSDAVIAAALVKDAALAARVVLHAATGAEA